MAVLGRQDVHDQTEVLYRVDADHVGPATSQRLAPKWATWREDDPVGKYDGLRDLLAGTRSPTVTLAFDDVAAAVPGGLPSSAYRYQAWWSNEDGGSHVQSAAWMVAGWAVDRVDLTGRTVVFRRSA